MSKKIIAIAAAIILAAIAVTGATLAWFTAEDTATNVLTTGKIGISILENGEVQEEGLAFTGVMPGDTKDKAVTVKTDADSANAWIRAKVEISWGEDSLLLPSMILIEYNDTNWTAGTDGWYYYKTEVVANTETASLFSTVKLSTEAGNTYAGQTATINVIAEAVQSAHNGNSAQDALSWTETTPITP